MHHGVFSKKRRSFSTVHLLFFKLASHPAVSKQGLILQDSKKLIFLETLEDDR